MHIEILYHVSSIVYGLFDWPLMTILDVVTQVQQCVAVVNMGGKTEKLFVLQEVQACLTSLPLNAESICLRQCDQRYYGEPALCDQVHATITSFLSQ